MNNAQKQTTPSVKEKTEVVNTKLNNIMSLEKKMFFTQKKFYLLFIVFIIIAVIAVVMKTYKPASKQPAVIKKAIIKQSLIKRSIDTGVIRRGLTGSAIDVSTGKIVKAARVFSPDDKTIYLELDLNTPPKGTIVDYIRYKDGRYVDNGEVTLAKANTNNLLFNWTISKLFANATRNGNWKITAYANGILSKRLNYVVTNNKVSYVYPDTPISPKDSDYTLKKTLSLVSK